MHPSHVGGLGSAFALVASPKQASAMPASPTPNFFSAARRVTDWAKLFVSSSNLLFIFSLVYFVCSCFYRGILGLLISWLHCSPRLLTLLQSSRSHVAKSPVDAAEKDAGDVAAIHLAEDGHKIIPNCSQSLVIAHKVAEERGPSLFHVEGSGGHPYLVSPVGRVSRGHAWGGMALNEPVIGRQAGLRIVEPEVVICHTD